MSGKHSSDWYKKDHKYDKYRDNLDYVGKKYDNSSSYGQSANNGVGQAIQSLVGDERLVTAIQTIVERHTAEALKNLEEKINTDSRRSVDHRSERHSASGLRSYDNPNYSSDRYNNDLVSSHRSDVRTGSNLIEYFDPDNVNQNIEDWLDKIDHLGSVQNWTEYERCYYMQNRLTGAAKTWYNRLRTTDLLWSEWKTGLVTTFSTRLDFANMVSEMLARQKQPTETMAQYFNDKVRLCERCDFTNDKAVSFIIYGLPKEFQAEARAFRCWTPNELYEEFLSKLDKTQAGRRSPEQIEKRPKDLPNDKYYSSHSSHNVTSQNSHTKRHHEESWEKAREPETRRESKSLRTSSTRTKSASDDKIRKCYNCRTGGHYSKDCPLPKSVRCWDCGSKNHKAGDCKVKSSKLMKRN